MGENDNNFLFTPAPLPGSPNSAGLAGVSFALELGKRLNWAMSDSHERLDENLKSLDKERSIVLGTGAGGYTRYPLKKPKLTKNRVADLVNRTHITNKGQGFNGIISALGMNAAMSEDSDRSWYDYFTGYGEELGSRNRATTTPTGTIAADNVTDVVAEIPHMLLLKYDLQKYGKTLGKLKQVSRFLHGLTASGFNLGDQYNNKYLNNESVHNLVGRQTLGYVLGENKIKNYDELQKIANALFEKDDAKQDLTFKPMTDIMGGIFRYVGNSAGEDSLASKVADRYWDSTTSSPSKYSSGIIANPFEDFFTCAKGLWNMATGSNDSNLSTSKLSTGKSLTPTISQRLGLTVRTSANIAKTAATVPGAAVSSGVRKVAPTAVKSAYKKTRHALGNGLRKIGVDASKLRNGFSRITGILLKNGGILYSPYQDLKYFE